MNPVTLNSGHAAIIPLVSTDDIETVHIEKDLPQPGEVTIADINRASNFGVMSGLQRHLECEPKVKVKAALEIMETIYANEFREKVRFFVQTTPGKNLFTELDDPVLKAEYAIRVARMMNKAEQGPWCELAMDLLKNETTRAECPKPALEMLAFIWADVGNHDQVIHWLAAAQSDRSKYKKAAFKFFFEGNFDKGLMILDQAPPGEDSEDFVSLISHGLRHGEAYEDADYRARVLTYQDGLGHKEIILRALCHLSLKGHALKLSLEMVSHCKNIYPMLALSDYITEIDERRDYVDALCNAAGSLDEERGETSGYGELYNLVKNERLSIYEAITMASVIPKPAARVLSLWERACGIFLKRDKTSEDFTELLAVLRATVKHLGMTVSSDHCADEWKKVLGMYVECGFFEEAKAVEATWRQWRKTCGESKHKTLYQDYEVRNLCSFSLFKYLDGNIAEAIADLKEALGLSHAIREEKPNLCDSLADNIYYAIREIKRSPRELTVLQKRVLVALECNPHSFEQIFGHERELAMITPLVQACTAINTKVNTIAGQVRGSIIMTKSVKERVKPGFDELKAAAAEAEKCLAAYRECFCDNAALSLADALSRLFQKIQKEEFPKNIKKFINEIQKEFSDLLSKLNDHNRSIYSELKKLGGK